MVCALNAAFFEGSSLHSHWLASRSQGLGILLPLAFELLLFAEKKHK